MAVNTRAVVKKLRRYFWGELFPYGTNDRGPAGANTPAVGKKLRGYYGGELFP